MGWNRTLAPHIWYLNDVETFFLNGFLYRRMR